MLPSIRAAVAEELVKRGLAQKEVSKLLGITAPAVSQYPDQRRRATYNAVFTSSLVSSLNSSIIPIAFRDFEFFSDKLR